MMEWEVWISIYLWIIGICIGSFLNVVIYRLPEKMSLSKPRSHCPTCFEQISWYENIPIFSYLFLKGKCRHCHSVISPRYLLIELFTGLLYLGLYLHTGFTLVTLFHIIFASLLLPLIFIDFDHKIILDRFHILITLLAIAETIVNFIVPMTSLLWYERLIGSIVAGLGFILISYVTEKITQREALGGGDIKLVAVCGLLLGWQLILLGIFMASFIACLVELPLIYSKKKERQSEIPFGPYLAIGIFIAYIFGNDLLVWYFNLFMI